MSIPLTRAPLFSPSALTTCSSRPPLVPMGVFNSGRIPGTTRMGLTRKKPPILAIFPRKRQRHVACFERSVHFTLRVAGISSIFEKFALKLWFKNCQHARDFRSKTQLLQQRIHASFLLRRFQQNKQLLDPENLYCVKQWCVDHDKPCFLYI